VCRLERGVVLNEAHVRSVRLMRCDIPVLEADEFASEHSLHLQDSRLGGLALTSARITGGLNLIRAILSNENGNAFNGDRMALIGGVVFRRATVTGELRLLGAQLGDLDLDGATLRNQNGKAFYGDGMVTSDAFFRRATVTGELCLIGAQIRGQLNLAGATLSNENGHAFDGSRTTVTGSAFFEGATVTGELRLLGAQIGGELDLVGTALSNQNRKAFNGDSMTVTGPALFGRATVTGELCLLGARISQQLDLGGARLTNVIEREQPNGRGQHVGIALQCQNLRADTLWLVTRSAIKGDVELRTAKVRYLVDRLESWPTPPSQLFLDDFSYGALLGADQDVDRRLEWVHRNHGFSPGVYDQLADVYRRAGRDSDAREVSIAREKDPRRAGHLGRASRVWIRFLGLTVAHGYKPWRAAWYLLGTLVVSTAIFVFVPSAERAMAPTKAASQSPTAANCTDQYECFEPLVYPLDVVLPVVDLHQKSNWLPSQDRPWGSWYRALTWALVAIGWALTTAVVAAIGTIWRR
jgi:hypothetical protein